ncbi:MULTISPECIES: hypothetical protein [unclassified Streptomyces]|uniref:hypothetical protein n=1 Tax=unclassified Streptomyces TaxID=2593676 RepID=UPI002E28FDA1|nr:hypothetical protein [Streptomyces sp. NBC_01423]WSX91156.1 hypothetical protein OH827_11700 [Streptomyces sp. NBC_00891]WSY05634.1 hypothetical protein OG464_11700 [Streptomyces sp. NBC_00890]WSZ07258.1 hypothetical protein OG704_11700 [Streptomyces sp. NBC_00869]WSZ25243.1 hypothetical protein OG498_21865 [Streptomyces sp. NBC_00870]
MITMTQERTNPTAEPGVDSIPVDVECIRAGLIHALELPLATTTREAIDATIHQVRGHLNLLMGEDLGHDSDDTVRELFRQAYTLLDLGRRPTASSPAFEAFAHLRETARVAQHFLDVFVRLRNVRSHRSESPGHPVQAPGLIASIPAAN